MHKQRRLYRSDPSARGVMSAWGRERERQWERGHQDKLAITARAIMSAWANTLTAEQRKQLGERAQRQKRRMRRISNEAAR